MVRALQFWTRAWLAWLIAGGMLIQAIGGQQAPGSFAITHVHEGMSARLPHNIPDFCAAPTATSTKSGNWSDPSTWSGGVVPGDAARVQIQAGHSITYNVVSNARLKCIGVYGVLKFATSVNTRLIVSELLIYPGSGKWEVGTATTPIAANVTAETIIAGALDTATDPDTWGVGVLGFGTVTMHGAVVSPTFARLTAERSPGVTTLPVDVATNWKAGARVVVAGSDQWLLDIAPYQQDWETLTLAGASGKTLTTTSGGSFTHQGARNQDGALEFLPHVGNLSRNVIIRSDTPAGTRGHIVFGQRADVDVRYVLVKDMGRTTIDPLDNSRPGHIGTNQQGRYALHLHHLAGPVVTPANGYQWTLIGNAIEGSPKWGITVHNAHYGLARDNVVYDAAGAGVMLEDGSETENLIEHNLVVKSYGTGEERGDGRGIWFDTGYEGTAFWARGPNSRFVNNVAANTNSFAYAIFPQDLQSARVPLFKGADTSISGQYVVKNMQATKILEFRGNEAYAVNGGLTLWDIGADCCLAVNEVDESTIKDFRVWHAGRYGMYGYGMNRVTFDGWVQRGKTDWFGVPYVFNLGLWFGDYLSRNVIVRNADIQGVRAGIVAPHKAGDLGDIYGAQPGTLLVENSSLRVNWGVNTQPQYGVTGGGSSLPPRQVFVNNVRWRPLVAPMPEGWGQAGITRSWNIDARNANIMVRDEFFVTKWQGVAGDDFEVFNIQQAPDFVPPATTDGLIGSPAPGLTNAQLWAQFGTAVAGKVAPCSATRSDVAGFVCAVH